MARHINIYNQMVAYSEGLHGAASGKASHGGFNRLVAISYIITWSSVTIHNRKGKGEKGLDTVIIQQTPSS